MTLSPRSWDAIADVLHLAHDLTGAVAASDLAATILGAIAGAEPRDRVTLHLSEAEVSVIVLASYIAAAA
jgi:hypothetical protein